MRGTHGNLAHTRTWQSLPSGRLPPSGGMDMLVNKAFATEILARLERLKPT